MSETLRPVPGADQVALEVLATRRRQLTELIAMERTGLEQALEPRVTDSHRVLIATLEAASSEVEAEFGLHIGADRVLVRKRAI